MAPRALLLGLLLLAPLLARADVPQGRDPLVVIVAASSPLRDMPMGTLRRIFLGEIVQSPSGDRFRPFNLPTAGAQRGRFDRVVLGMEPGQVARYWVDRQIRAQGTSPRAITGATLLRRIVERIPGAIGYVPLSQVTPGVRALRLSGKRPGEAGYPL